MLRRVNDLEGFVLRAKDGDIGKIDNLYIDETSWDVRYFVINTGPWLFGRKVLISPEAAQQTNWDEGVLSVNLTQQQVKDAPEFDTAMPVSRQMETDLRNHYGWPLYWTGGMSAANAAGKVSPAAIPAGVRQGGTVAAAPVSEQTEATTEPTDVQQKAAEQRSNLRSFDEITGYDIQATDGEIGHLSDLFVDEKEWRIRYAMVNTRDWLPGRDVLISPEWISWVDWNNSDIHVDMTKESIKSSPEYDADEGIDRNYERALYDHYERSYYWL